MAPKKPVSAHKSGSKSHVGRRQLRRFRDVHPTRRGIVWAWWTFTLTFGFLRCLTWAIHAKVGGIGNISAGGTHIHHYIWGILILAIVGACGLVERSPTWHIWMGALYGIGVALVVDEAALLIDLKDVYWSSQGGVSIAIGLILGGAVGTLLALTHPDATSQRSVSARR